MKLTDPSGATVDVAEESVDRYLAAGYTKAGAKPEAATEHKAKARKGSTRH